MSIIGRIRRRSSTDEQPEVGLKLGKEGWVLFIILEGPLSTAQIEASLLVLWKGFGRRIDDFFTFRRTLPQSPDSSFYTLLSEMAIEGLIEQEVLQPWIKGVGDYRLTQKGCKKAAKLSDVTDQIYLDAIKKSVAHVKGFGYRNTLDAVLGDGPTFT